MSVRKNQSKFQNTAFLLVEILKKDWILHTDNTDMPREKDTFNFGTSLSDRINWPLVKTST